MTYGQVKRAALRLINAESVAGTPIPSGYNNQADYLRTIPGLVDDAQMLLATTVRKIAASAELDALAAERVGSWDVYTLPGDLWQLRQGGVLCDGKRRDDYRQSGGKLWLPGDAGSVQVEYWRYPVSLGETPDDDTPLDNSPDGHAAIPYYVAGQLVMYDDAFRYAALHNEWESRLTRMGEPVRAETRQISDAYAGFGLGGIG